MTVTFDSSAWIEYFAGSEKGNSVNQVLESKEPILTPSVCLFEIKNKYLQEGKEFQQRIDFICTNSRIIDIDTEIALLGAEVKKKHKLYTIDAIIYATAQQYKSKLLTGDRHFQELKNVELL